MIKTNLNIVVRGGGDTGTAVCLYLFKSGFKRIILLEKDKPTSIRREVCFSDAVYSGEKTVEGVKAVKSEVNINFAERDFIPVIIDENAEFLNKSNPDILIDAILTKRKWREYPLNRFFVIGLGPEFEAGKNCHVAIETYRGHNLGRIVYTGKPAEPTGIPGDIIGFKEERLLRAPVNGIVETKKEIGEFVKKDEIVAVINGVNVKAKIFGILRGIIHSNIYVKKNQKIGDIDPRGIKEYCYTISDRSRCIAGAVLLAVLEHQINQ